MSAQIYPVVDPRKKLSGSPRGLSFVIDWSCRGCCSSSQFNLCSLINPLALFLKDTKLEKEEMEKKDIIQKGDGVTVVPVFLSWISSNSLLFLIWLQIFYGSSPSII